MFTIIGAMAELERNIIRERVLAGMEHARRNGTKSGKAVGRPKAVIDRDEVVRLRHEVCRGARSVVSCGWAARLCGGCTKSGRLHRRLSMAMWILQNCKPPLS